MAFFGKIRGSLPKVGGFQQAPWLSASSSPREAICPGEHREKLLRIKRGELSFDQVMQHALSLDKLFQQEFERTTLPEQPDFEAVNAFLVKARRSAVEN